MRLGGTENNTFGKLAAKSVELSVFQVMTFTIFGLKR